MLSVELWLIDNLTSKVAYKSMNNQGIPFFHFGGVDDIQDFTKFDHGFDGEKDEKSRLRNREHAKKTRLRKKLVLEGMKTRLQDLQNEVRFFNT